ncbi:MAG: tRNA (guanosine(46)-N7)-methyltransferase TrmB [Chromatiales bacterium]|nr:tRNA (guanosine(46)-N7)-methyltransferase TrmB [Chromatiales bacterium]
MILEHDATEFHRSWPGGRGAGAGHRASQPRGAGRHRGPPGHAAGYPPGIRPWYHGVPGRRSARRAGPVRPLPASQLGLVRRHAPETPVCRAGHALVQRHSAVRARWRQPAGAPAGPGGRLLDHHHRRPLSGRRRRDGGGPGRGRRAVDRRRHHPLPLRARQRAAARQAPRRAGPVGHRRVPQAGGGGRHVTGPSHPRQIRSFVRRAGRQTRAQERALAELWPRFGLPPPAPGASPVIDLAAAFDRPAPCTLEIGFGNGDALVAMAAEAPDRNLLGAEVHAPGVGHCLLAIERLGLTNVRLLMEDAVEVLRERLPARSLAGVNLYFPDPWHKKRHHKRRLVQPDFVALLSARLAPGGYFHVATDWPDYAAHIQAVMAGSPAFRAAAPADLAGVAGPRPRTRFEARGERLGHPIWEAVYQRSS